MPTLAILDDTLPMQLRERPEELDPIRVVWTGTDVERLRSEAPVLRPTVLALDLQRLGEDPVSEARRLGDLCNAELVLLLYQFAPRDVIREAARAGTRPVKTPIRLGALRTQLTSVIVRNILGDSGANAAATAKRDERQTSRPRALPALSNLGTPVDGIPPRRYSRAQLGRLAEIQSSIDCECPNHLSELLVALTAFEDYSRACQNRDDADAKMHSLLHRRTAEARSIMEEALSQLLVHEKIVL